MTRATKTRVLNLLHKENFILMNDLMEWQDTVGKDDIATIKATKDFSDNIDAQLEIMKMNVTTFAIIK